MPEPPASPRASRLATPGWLDARLVLGVLLVLVSVVVGARVLSAADRSTLVWAAADGLAAGTTVDEARLERVRVRFFDGLEDRYVPVTQDPTGLVLSRALGPGELLPRRALLAPQEDVERRLVTVAVDAARLPAGLGAGDLVDVWLTPGGLDDDPAAAPPTAPPADPAAPPSGQELALTGAQPVLLQVPVEAVERDGGGFGGGGSTTVPVVLSVAPDDVARLVSATALGRIDLVLLPDRARQPDLGDG